MLYCTYNLLNMFRALICPSSGARDYTCVIAAYGVKCCKILKDFFILAALNIHQHEHHTPSTHLTHSTHLIAKDTQ